MANIDRINKKLDKKNSNTVAYYAAMAKNNNFFYNVIRYFINRKNRHPVKTTIITYSNDCSLFTPIKSFFNVGIVFQGPVMHDCNFTVDSIKIARSLYPEVKIILSTWKNELTDLERVELKKFRCIILESDSLSAEHKGTGEKLGHMNNQILSSLVFESLFDLSEK